MRDGVNDPTILCHHQCDDNTTAYEKMAKKVIVKNPGNLISAINLLLPLPLPLTMPFLHNPPQYRPVLESQ
jgi:hypothetical protein